MPTYEITYEVEVSVLVEAKDWANAQVKGKQEIKSALNRHSYHIGGILDSDCLSEDYEDFACGEDDG
jgi:hypothetical protein